MAGGFAKPVYHTGKYLEGKELIWPITLIISLFFLWGFSYGLVDVLNAHFQAVLDITKLESTGLQVMYFGGGYVFFSPIAAEVMKRFGYKKTIHMGLTLYSLGAVFFWPVAHYTTANNKKAAFGGFLVCTFVIACGLATLETAANSYATVIGNPRTAARRLQFCQAWNGVASFVGPLIASNAFFSGENANNLTNVQYVYLAVAIAGLLVNILFAVTRMPEVPEEVMEAMAKAEAADSANGVDRPLWKQYNMWFGLLAQFCYVGAQVTVATFFINYTNETGGVAKSRSSFLLSMSLLIFTIARFIGTGILTFIAPDFLLMIYAGAAIALSAACTGAHGSAAIGCIMALFFFESIMYPIIFVMGTEKLGRHTRRGSGILVMGVGGGAVFPPIQGAVADAASTHISYIVPCVGFVVVLAYAVTHWLRNGRHIKRQTEVVSHEAAAEGNATVHTNALGGVRGAELSMVRTISREGKTGSIHNEEYTKA